MKSTAVKSDEVDKLPIGTEFHLIIPTTTRKNTSHRAVPTKKENGDASAKLILSAGSRDFRNYVRVLSEEQDLPKFITYGAWGIEIITYWPRLRHLEGEDFPYGDVDASITPVMDAICKGAHVFDDDVRLGPLAADHDYDPNSPRIEVTLKRWR